MSDDITTNKTPVLNYTSEDLERFLSDNIILNVVSKRFKRIRRAGIKLILERLIKGKLFKASELGTVATVIRFNWKYFEASETEVKEGKVDKEIKKDEYIELRNDVIYEINYIEKNRKDFEEDKLADEKTSELYVIKKFVTFETIRKLVCDEAGNIKFVYNFDTPDTELLTPKNTNILQRVKIQILSPGVKFDYPLIFKYHCEACENNTERKSYEVVSSNTKTRCQHYTTFVNSAGESKTRVCGNVCFPDKDTSENKDAYFYEIGYEDKDTKFAANAFSFNEYKPGYYECVLYKISSGRMELFFIVDIKRTDPNKLEVPFQNPEENYLFSLQKCFDEFILQQTGMEIYGLNPVKCSLILQKLAAMIKERLILNVMMVGDPSTGKSMLLKYYSYLLYNYRNLSSNGLSISIPGLRGTKTTINLFGKDIRIVTIGHLGTFHSIHIDEAGENTELVQNLKSFLLEDDYSYDKAGSTGISNERTAHINLSQNLDYDHVGQYRGAIRKAYKDLNMTIGGMEKEDWDEEWDLFLPIHQYDNPHLRKIIKEKRLEFKQKQVWWIDGLDYALHERFPFYFYLVNEQQDEELDRVVGRNSSRPTLNKKLEVIRALYVEKIDEFFSSLEKFRFCEEDKTVDKKVDKIIMDYGFLFDTRTRAVFYLIARLSRIINRRDYYKEMDFELVRWYLETTNIKLDIVTTRDYKIKGPPNKEEEQKKNIEIEESKTLDESFGLPKGDFS